MRFDLDQVASRTENREGVSGEKPKAQALTETDNSHKPPKDWLGGLAESWRSDLIAAFSVALVALPLALGIGLASDVPPLAGVISIVVGGVVTTLIRSGHVGINGPTPGLITVIAAAMASLKDPDGTALPYVLAAVVVAGVVQIVMGLFKMGSVGNYFPSSVINGLLAAIGVIIIAKQIHVALGTGPAGGSAINELLSIPDSLEIGNPLVATVALVSIALLAAHPKVKSRLVHFIPAPMWVLAFSIPLAHLFGFFQKQTIEIGALHYEVGPDFLVKLPENLLGSLTHPDFSKITHPAFWVVVVSIALVASIETLSSTKAVDKIDPYKRKTDLNRDLIAVGVASAVSGFVGGLPVITVIVRSSVNVNHGGRTRWSNFFHGVICLVFVALFPKAIQQVPLAALAAILIFTGYKLASPKLFKDSLRFGNEQLLILIMTLVATLQAGLLMGLVEGVFFALIVHWLWSGLGPLEFVKAAVKPDVTTELNDDNLHIKCRGLTNFLTLRALDKALKEAPEGGHVVIDLAHTKLADFTTLEFIHNFSEEYARAGGRLEIVEATGSSPSSKHPFSMRHVRSLIEGRARLNERQQNLQALAEKRGWEFSPEINWHPRTESDFHFFQTRPVEYANNTIRGSFVDLDSRWTVEDVTFDEGAFFASEEHHMTILTIELPFRIPVFALEKADLLDRLLEYAGYQEADFVHCPDICKDFEIKAPRNQDLKPFFTDTLLEFLRTHELYHLESKGDAIMVFKYDRLAGAIEVFNMIQFGYEFEALLRNKIVGDVPEDEPEPESESEPEGEADSES